MTIKKTVIHALADALRMERPASHWDANKRVQWDLDCKAVAEVCKQFNPTFKESMWIERIGGKAEKP